RSRAGDPASRDRSPRAALARAPAAGPLRRPRRRAMTIDLSELVLYWQGELSPERASEIEDAVFADAETARMLDAVARLQAGVRALVAAGRLQVGLTVAAVDELERAGLRVRS